MTHYQQNLLNALMRQRLEYFIQKSFQTASPSDQLLWNWHLSLIADHLEQCARGDIKRLIITVPPRSLKSICASVAFPAWLLGHDPHRQIICVSYSADLAAKMARDSRSVMDSVWYRSLFPNTRLKRNAELDLVTTKQGGRYSTSVGGTLTGRGGSMIIIDDPMKPQDAMSESMRKNVKQWYDGTLYSRLDNKRDDVIILVMQRLHMDDLVSHVLEKENWVHLNLPAIAERDERFELSDGRIYTRSAGGILHPERETKEVLDNILRTIGSIAFSAQYQQSPVPIEGNLIRLAWFERYDKPPVRQSGDMVIQSWDTASSTSEMSDYSVCITCLIQGDNYYLLNVYRERLDYPDLIRAVITQARKFSAKSILIEDSSSGIALNQQLRRETNGLNIIKVKPAKDKVLRMNNPSVVIEAGRVFLPEKASWLEEFQKEILAFPGGTHDDQVDSLSQTLNWDRRRNTVHVLELRGF